MRPAWLVACGLVLFAGSACTTDQAAGPGIDGGAQTRAPRALAISKHALAPVSVSARATERPAAASAPADGGANQAQGPDAGAPDAGGPDVDALYPLHGVVFHFLAQVFGEPVQGSPVVGAMRRGARFRATERVDGTGCDEGWYGVPGGGYVCRGRGFILGRTPQSFDPSPMPPSLEDPLPYPYAWVAGDRVPQYWRIPTADEEAAVADWLEAHPDASPTPADADGGEPDDTPDGGAISSAPASVDGGVSDGGTGLPDVVRLVMRRGFYVSVDVDETSDDGRQFVRTVRGTYVRADALVPAKPSPTPGVRLGGALRLPVAFVYRDGPTRWRLDPATGNLVRDGNFARFTPLAVRGTLTRKGRGYVIGADGSLVHREVVRLATARARPAEVPEGARWIDVRLSEQTLVAYDGDQPVYATVVSSGKPGFETPTGLYRIQAKYVTTTMDDLASEEPYLIEDVPWVMYFQGSYALHGAFWHSSFGTVHSHGCVNLAPADAQWLFRWSSPALPPSWHAVLARDGRDGTYVLIES